jgi:tetratricopeptide (TPR) repeat protein
MLPEVVDERALEHFQRAADLGLMVALGELGCSYGRLGKKEEAFKILSQMDELSKDRYISPLSRAEVYCGLGMYDRAFEWLEKAFSQNKPYLFFILCPDKGLQPWPQEFRMDKRYRALVRKMKKVG